jgi:hypothetical protein
MSNEHALTFVKDELKKCFAAQVLATAEWHTAMPQSVDEVCSSAERDNPGNIDTLTALALGQHFMNFSLWHVEDDARRKDVGDEVIANCKRTIDGFNQRRNDFMEKVDTCLATVCAPFLASGVTRHNTESLGTAVDRMSILSLKIYHMREETERKDASAEHIAACERKLAVLNEQRADLGNAILELMDDFAAGLKAPKVYYQFKMYNDPALNPALYKNR